MFKNYFSKKEKGQGLVEYALVLVLVAVVVIAILTALGPTIGGVFSNVVASLDGSGGGYDAIVGPVCENRGWPSGQELAFPEGPGGAGVVFYLQNDGLAYTRYENDTFFTDRADEVVTIYGTVPSGATYYCP